MNQITDQMKAIENPQGDFDLDKFRKAASDWAVWCIENQRVEALRLGMQISVAIAEWCNFYDAPTTKDKP